MSGAATPHDPSQVITTCDGLRLMQQNVAALVELRARQERLMAEAMQLQQDMVDFCAATREQVAALLARTPLDLRPRRTKVNLDDDPESTEAEQLPPPLQPQVVSREGTMCRSLSDFLSNITETTCTNTSFAPPPVSAVVPPTFSGAISTASAVEPSTADETVKPVAKHLDTVEEVPAVLVTTEDAVCGLAMDEGLEESSASHADDSASVSSLLLDTPVTSAVDISLLDDPFIAIGADCEKDSLLGEPDADPNWNADDSDQIGPETVPMTSSIGLSSNEPAGTAVFSSEATFPSADTSTVPDTVDSVADTDTCQAVATNND